MTNIQNKIKICHLTSNHVPKDGRIFYKECTSLANAGYDVSLVVCGEIDEICNDVHIIGIPQTFSGRFSRMITSGKAVYEKAKSINADIYHIHDPELLPYAIKLKKNGKKVIFDSHEFYGEQILCKPYLPQFLRKIASKIYKLIEEYICTRIDCVIQVCTINGKDYFKERCKKSIFITNAPILNKMVAPQKNLKERLNKVVLVGSLTEARGITKIAEAIKKTPCKLVLAGQFYSAEYEKKIRRICGEKLDYRGVIPSDEVQNLLNNCGIGVSLFLRVGQYDSIDTLPTKNYEYMYAGLPIIMSDFPYLLQFNRHNKVGINVNADDTDAIADAINYILSHPEEAVQMGENGRLLTHSTFNWSNEEKKLLNLYTSLI